MDQIVHYTIHFYASVTSLIPLSTGNKQILVDSQLAAHNGLLVDTIRANNTLPTRISIVDPCAVGATSSNKPFTVNGTLTAKAATVQNDLTVSGSLSVSGSYARNPWCSILVATSTAGKTSGAFAVASFGQQTKGLHTMRT